MWEGGEDENENEDGVDFWMGETGRMRVARVGVLRGLGGWWLPS
jgi:hypothetical protein